MGSFSIDTLYLIDRLKEQYKEKDLKVIKVILPYGDISDRIYGRAFNGFYYYMQLFLVPADNIFNIKADINSKKDVYTINLLTYANKIMVDRSKFLTLEENQTGFATYYEENEMTNYLYNNIKENSFIEFTMPIILGSMNEYKNIKSIPYINNNKFPDYEPLIINDDPFTRRDKFNLDTNDEKENRKLKSFCKNLLYEIEVEKSEYQKDLIEKLKKVNAKINNSKLLTEEEKKLYKRIYNDCLEKINKEQENYITSSEYTNIVRTRKK